jgi:hypothetical protein
MVCGLRPRDRPAFVHRTPHEMPFETAFEAILVGDAVEPPPLGLIASEPAKAAVARQRVPPAAAVTSLTIETSSTRSRSR